MNNKISRNSPCPCGSGKKYKRCCLNKDSGKAIQTNQELPYQYCYHGVAFLDLLGQKEAFDEFIGIPSTETEKALLLDRLKHTIGYIRELRDGFKDFFHSLEKDRDIPPEVPLSQHAEFLSLRKTELHVQTFSDTVIAWTPILITSDRAMLRSALSLYNILATSAVWNMLSLASGHPLRGGIDVDCGIAITPGGDEIYGRALNSAYALEKLAESPRILIGPGLLKFIDTIEADSINSPIAQCAKRFAERCRGLITRDSDNSEILHFLGPMARELMWNPRYHNDGVIPAHKFAISACEKFSNNSKLGPRYKQLLAYFDAHIADWRTPPPNITEDI